MTLKELQLKLHNKLKDSGWSDKLKTFTLSNDFLDILKTLYTNSQNGEKFTPVLKDVFSFLTECPYHKLKIVIVNDKPFFNANVSNGLALSTKDGIVNAPLNLIYNDLENTLYPEGFVREPDLTYLANQGVMLLNTSLTTTLNTVEPHTALWSEFVNHLFDYLNAYNPGLIYVFLGDVAKPYSRLIDSNNYKFFTLHPIYDVNPSNPEWMSNNLFKKINDLCMDIYGESINWVKNTD